MAVDFTKQMKRDFTILAPDIFPTHMELLQEVSPCTAIMSRFCTTKVLP